MARESKLFNRCYVIVNASEPEWHTSYTNWNKLTKEKTIERRKTKGPWIAKPTCSLVKALDSKLGAKRLEKTQES